jgi:hypothetical protein
MLSNVIDDGKVLGDLLIKHSMVIQNSTECRLVKFHREKDKLSLADPINQYLWLGRCHV